MTFRILEKIFRSRSAEIEKNDFYFHKYVIVSLVCPLTKKLVDIPARGIKCEHVECFDLKEYIIINCKKSFSEPKWACPICDKEILPHQIVVDSHIALILASSDEEKIQFGRNLAWSKCFSDLRYIDSDAARQFLQ